MAWEVNGTPNTLTGTADDCDITDLTAKEFNQFLFHKITSGESQSAYTFDDDGGSNYADRKEKDGAADVTLTSQTKLIVNHTHDADEFHIMDMINLATEEKLMIIHTTNRRATGVTNAPGREIIAAKWVETVDSATRVDVNNVSGGSFGTDTNLSCLGTN